MHSVVPREPQRAAQLCFGRPSALQLQPRRARPAVSFVRLRLGDNYTMTAYATNAVIHNAIPTTREVFPVKGSFN